MTMLMGSLEASESLEIKFAISAIGNAGTFSGGERITKAEMYRYRDRRNRKRDFRRLWITRINAAARQHGMSYSQLIHGLTLAGIELDRKVLADIAVRDADTFRRIAQAAREATPA